ncbi:MAG: DUF4157 domain-containing protein [Alphaproteobacteria bacterium]|nr:DUF4157 domain-containing protein [Alphaproteobacteria bacterium]
MASKAPVWLKACRTVLLTAATLVGIDQVALPNLPGRVLTDGETVMLREVFRDSIDYNKVRIHHSRAADFWLNVQGAEGVTHKNVIVMRDNKCSDDYSRCHDDYYRYVLMHETAHVWQGQNGLMPGALKLAFENYSRILPNNNHHQHYEYRLTQDKPLSAYNVEQQASIITDYHMHIRHGENAGVFLNVENYASPHAQKAAYESTLHTFHQNPSSLRR